MKCDAYSHSHSVPVARGGRRGMRCKNEAVTERLNGDEPDA